MDRPQGGLYEGPRLYCLTKIFRTCLGCFRKIFERLLKNFTIMNVNDRNFASNGKYISLSVFRKVSGSFRT